VFVDTFGKVNNATRKLAPVGHVLEPAGQAGLVAANRACTPSNAHWNSVTPPLQLLSVTFIDPVESTTIATFHGCAMPCMDAVAFVDTERLEMPNSAMKCVETVAVWVTTTALLTAPDVAHVNPAGISMLRHFCVTVVTTVPSLEL
jgi:hypothetical protein